MLSDNQPMVSALPRIGSDSPLLQHLTRRIAGLAGEMVDAAWESVDLLRAVPPGHFRDEVAPAITGAYPKIVQAMNEGRDLTRAELAEFVFPVVERHATDRLPLPVLVAALHSGIAHLWAVVFEIAARVDGTAVAAFGIHLARLVGSISVVMTEAYQEIDSGLQAVERETRQALCSALLRGEPAERLAAGARIVLSDSYRVIALQLAEPDPHVDAGAALVERRRMRQAQHILDEFGMGNVLSTFNGQAGIVLLPAAPGEAVGEVAPEPRTLLAAISARLGADVHAGERHAAALPDIPAAATEAEELARLAWQLKRPAGLYRLDDFLFEYQATRPGPARDELARLVAPLQQYPHLLDTLRLHLQHGTDRKSAAAELCVHPNTFSYRLRRVAELTGIDPVDPDGFRLLAAALTIHLIDQPPVAGNARR